MLTKLQSQLLLLRAGALMTITEIWIRRSGFRRCRNALSWLAVHLPFARTCPASLPLAQQIADIVDRARTTTSLYPAQCLTRSLVLHYFLLRYGQDSVIRLGVRKITGRFAAHAWIESTGVELNEPEPANDIYVAMGGTAAEQNSIKT